jgi:hypothetical protein
LLALLIHSEPSGFRDPGLLPSPVKIDVKYSKAIQAEGSGAGLARLEDIMRKPKLKPIDRSTPVVQLAVNNPIITHEQMAALHFEPVPTFVGLSDDFEKLERHEGFLRKIAIISRVAVSMLGLTRAEIIENIRKEENPRRDDEMLKWLMDGREAADELVDMIRQAETRYGIAMARLQPDHAQHRRPRQG